MSKTLENTSKLSKTIKNFTNQSKTIKNYQETCENRHIGLKIVKILRKLSENLQKLAQISLNTSKTV